MKASRSGTVAVSASQRVHNTGVYMARHWQLYLIFILPAVALTLIFKYMPMGGILIAFQDYNPFQDIWEGASVGRSRTLPALHVLAGFQRYLVNTLKLSVYGLLWGFPIPIILAFLLNRIESKKIKQKSPAGAVYAQLHLGHRPLRYGPCPAVGHRPAERAAAHQHQLYDHPRGLPPHLHHQRHLAGRRLVLHHVHSLPLQCQQGPEGSGHDRRRKPAAADHDVEWPAIKDMVVIQFILQAGNIMSIGFEKAYASRPT